MEQASSRQEGKESSGWKSSAGYIWSLIGSAVGFANILSFSAHSYKNGGGAFLLPYIAALLLLGIPLLMLEGVIGKRWKSPLVTAYGLSSLPFMRFFGWMAIIACFTIGAFYIVLTGYSVAYVYFFATGAVPIDTAAFFKEEFLRLSSGLFDWGELSVAVLSATLVVIVATWWVMAKEVCHGVEKICSWFMPLLALMVLAFAIFVSFLPGGSSGWFYFLRPDFSRLGDPLLWRDVFGQLLFSLSLGLGIIVGYSRHTKEEFNIAKAMRYVALGDFSVSFMAGAAIFGCIAHISYVQGVPFESLMASDSTFEIGFILFPKILQQCTPWLLPFLGTFFFFSIFIAGITGVFSIVESIAGNVQTEFALSRKRAVSLTMALLLPSSLLFCFGNGIHLIDALEPLVLGMVMLISTLAMIGLFLLWEPTIYLDPIWSSSWYNKLAFWSMRTLVPCLLILILVSSSTVQWSSLDGSTYFQLVWIAIAALVSAGLVRYGGQPQSAVSRASPLPSSKEAMGSLS